ncbi:hypothetical protein [Pontibacter anaerobius]|uniref:Uncharacterized protein n=1 Tax=Pontibacter anaerobius TaxID=2993940 RepID=A0ABT3RKS3_9BACT|nr:hypothetical protein [Pontibacter anaerobius]MCX2742212.1 hypothetical protein [Pontibacter anaerobius]
MIQNELNTLNLIVAALYLRYRKGSDHWLSAMWAKTIVGLAIAFTMLTLIEIALVTLVAVQARVVVGQYYIIVFFSVWALSVLLVNNLTLSNNALADLELYPEDYSRGNKLALVVLSTATLLYLLVGMYTKDI